MKTSLKRSKFPQFKEISLNLRTLVARVISGRLYDVLSAKVLEELNWHLLEQRRKYNKLMFIYKVQHKELQKSTISLFSVGNNTKYSLRSNKINCALQKPTTNYIKKSISYSGANLE